MPPRERKRNPAAQRNMEMLEARRNKQIGDKSTHSNGKSSILLTHILSFVSIIRSFFLSLLTPDRFWIILFVPSFIQYMHLLRTSLKPHPLTIGSVIDIHGGLTPLLDMNSKIEVVAEGLDGMLEAPLWRHDPDLGRGYLLFSQVEFNRLWRWEEGGGAFTIGRSLFLEHAGCHDRILNALKLKDSTCSSIRNSGVRDMSLPPSIDGALQPIILCEGGHQRISRLEANGTRTPIASWTQSDSDCSVTLDKEGGMYYTSSTDEGRCITYQPSLSTSEGSLTIKKDLTSSAHLALSPCEKFLYVAEGSLGHVHWTVYRLGNTSSEPPVTFSSSLSLVEPGGMAVDIKRNLYAACGEEGVLVMDSAGTPLGTISTGGLKATDVALGPDGILYITTKGSVLRVPTKSALSKT
mmetsp:Transcript_5037/g.6521  ORF Transcript_5037/g.6521 Transcript_5037/m.6521 type:complete len:408 (+) Transcript_5037:92-1315(+)